MWPIDSCFELSNPSNAQRGAALQARLDWTGCGAAFSQQCKLTHCFPAQDARAGAIPTALCPIAFAQLSKLATLDLSLPACGACRACIMRKNIE